MFVGQGLIPQPIPYVASGTAIADANGRASLVLATVPVGRRWRFTSVVVQSTSVLLSTATLYKSISDAPAFVLDSSGPLGGNNNTTGTIIDLGPGEIMRVVWTGCTPGAQCSATGQVQQYSM